ncbi:MAG: TIGR02556 family CRISPR-associated protein, partial [Actinobacteria bacterium]|nr:TIGR02556 family CRISPR-associated protein [Actinomycetota bacterium]
MIKSVKEIGELVLKREGKDLLNVLIDNPNPLGKYPYVICIELKQKGDDLKFSDVVMEEFEEGKIGKYLYKRIGGFGPDLSPTSRVGREIEVTLQRKILGWFRMVSKKDI